MDNQKITDNDYSFMKKVIQQNNDFIEKYIQKKDHETAKVVEEELKKIGDVKTHPDYVKKSLVAKEKIKIMSSFRLNMTIIMLLLMFNTLYSVVFGAVASIIGIILWGVPMLSSYKEEKRLSDTYDIVPSAMVKWLSGYRKKVDKNVIKQ